MAPPAPRHKPQVIPPPLAQPQPEPPGTFRAGKGRGPGAQGAEEPGRGGTLPVAARRWGRRARRAARPRWAGQGPAGLGARGGAMRGVRAAPFRPRLKLVLLPLLVLLCHRTRSQGEWWSELVSGALPPRSPRERRASACTASLRNERQRRRRPAAPSRAGTRRSERLANAGWGVGREVGARGPRVGWRR